MSFEFFNMAATLTDTFMRVAVGRGHWVVVDAQVPHPAPLIQALPSHTQVLVLNRDEPALVQLHRQLQHHTTPVLGLHLVGCGEPGRLCLGNGWLDTATLAQQHEVCAALTTRLDDEAHCWVYGGHSGQGDMGRSFINALADALCMHVHAASHAVGAQAQGGSWTLDCCTAAPHLAAYNPVASAWKHAAWPHVLMPDSTLHHMRIEESA